MGLRHVQVKRWSQWLADPKNVPYQRLALGVWILFGSAFVCMAVAIVAWLELEGGSWWYPHSRLARPPGILLDRWGAGPPQSCQSLDVRVTTYHLASESPRQIVAWYQTTGEWTGNEITSLTNNDYYVFNRFTIGALRNAFIAKQTTDTLIATALTLQFSLCP